MEYYVTIANGMDKYKSCLLGFYVLIIGTKPGVQCKQASPDG